MNNVLSRADALERLSERLHQEADLDFAVLIGSRATGDTHAASDWDIALQWSPGVDWPSRVSRAEIVRRTLAGLLQVAEAEVDLIDLNRANLTMRATVAEEGIVLCGEGSLSWAYFLQRTWRDLEDFYWNQHYAA